MLSETRSTESGSPEQQLELGLGQRGTGQDAQRLRVLGTGYFIRTAPRAQVGSSRPFLPSEQGPVSHVPWDFLSGY